MIACRAGYVLLPTHRTPSQAVLPDTSRGVHYLGKCAPGIAADGDDLWTTPRRSPRLRRADRAGPWAELTVRWQADPHKRTSAEERKRHGRAEVSPTDATSLLRAASLRQQEGRSSSYPISQASRHRIRRPRHDQSTGSPQRAVQPQFTEDH